MVLVAGTPCMCALLWSAGSAQLCGLQDGDEFWMYDELKTRVVHPHTLRNKYVNGAVKDKDSDKMIASRSAHVSNCTATHDYMCQSTHTQSCGCAMLAAKPTICKKRLCMPHLRGQLTGAACAHPDILKVVKLIRDFKRHDFERRAFALCQTEHLIGRLRKQTSAKKGCA